MVDRAKVRAFKMLLVESNEKKIERDAESELVEFEDYWWATKNTVESSEEGNYFKTQQEIKDEAKEANAKKAAATEAELRSAKPKAPPTPLQKAGTKFDELFDTKKETRNVGQTNVTVSGVAYYCRSKDCDTVFFSQDGSKRNS